MPTELSDDEWVSQKVSGSRVDIDSPRPGVDIDGLSVIRGRVSPTVIFQMVVKSGSPTSDDGVRYARVGDLRDAGFIVTSSPTRRNADHVSVTAESDWGHVAAFAFVSCFAETVWFNEAHAQEGEGA